jgi:class 3 adenylate cyclase
MGAYQRCCEEVVGHWDGHLAEFLGDGAVVYFGWPIAHEDDAERAVHAALELTSAVGRLSAAGASLSARVGIATGLVVVGEINNRLRTRREGAVGGTVNVAARLQAAAAPGTVAITLQTRQLVGDRFALESVGLQTLKGMSTPVEMWLVKGVLSGKSRFEARRGAHVSTLTHLGGRCAVWSCAGPRGPQVTTSMPMRLVDSPSTASCSTPHRWTESANR